jgi:hypothetical protein
LTPLGQFPERFDPAWRVDGLEAVEIPSVSTLGLLLLALLLAGAAFTLLKRYRRAAG